MTEVASLMPTDHRLTSVRHYEAGPPAGLELVEPGETFATTKEEEWVSKKKTEVLNTKQIETRVKRQVVLEDGKVVEDSGPMVTTNTTEDTETQEHHQTELRKLGDDDNKDQKAINKEQDEPDTKNWISVPNPDGVVREVKERRVVSREETEEIKETEDVQHLGDITDEEFLAAIHSGRSDLRQVLRQKEGNRTVLSTGPRLIRDTSKTNKITDTEETRELSSVLPDGKIVTETERTTEHEELNDDELPENVPIPKDFQKETTQRYLKTRDQEDVDYIADGVNIGHEMRFKTETMEVERRGDGGGVDEMDCFDSLSARVRRNRSNNVTRQPHRYRGIENGESPLDRKDALTRRPLDFDQEEETRKVETSKWLEHHFGSDSRSSNNDSLIDEQEEQQQPPKTSFFNVTIKSQPSSTTNLRNIEPYSQKTYISTAVNNGQRVYSPVEAERDRNPSSGFYKGITEWSSERRDFQQNRRSPVHFRTRSPSPILRRSPSPDYRPHHSPVPDYRSNHSPTPDYNRNVRRLSPNLDVVVVTSPTPPQRKRSERRRVDERTRYESSGRYSRSNGRIEDDERDVRRMEPPPDYSPPNPPPMPSGSEKKSMQRTRFAADPPKVKSGNIIGQSIRKLVGKIRSASAERKARQRAKRSPSPSYQQGHIIDGNIGHHHHQTMDRPVQRYYLGEDPFAGSIYGRENKYDGVRPARNSRRSNHQNRDEEHERSQSTLGRFNKSSSRVVNSSVEEQRNSQTLPRHHHRHEPPTRLEQQHRSNSTINVSIINTVSPPLQRPIINDGPTKPARTYRSNLSRSKSLNVNDTTMYSTNNQNVNRLNTSSIGLKSPGLISSLDRSQKDQQDNITGRFVSRNGTSDAVVDNTSNKRIFLSNLKERAPELFKTLHENDDEQWKLTGYKTQQKNNSYSGDIYEPPTRLRPDNQALLRRGSNSSTDYSETYHTTTRNDDPVRPSVTNTVKSFSKRTIPSKDGRSVETIESSETKSVTKSHFKGGDKFYDDKIYSSGNKPVVIEVRNYRK